MTTSAEAKDSPPAPFAHEDFGAWYEANERHLRPPICNRLMFGDQLKVMFVGGKKANERTDYHVEDGEEFFYMIKGDMTLKVLEQGKHRRIEIKEGETFLLPAHIPHSPQRKAGSLGLVIERERLPGEIDAMQWFVPGTTDVLWRRTFECRDLGKDLVPVVAAFKASVEAKTGKARPEGSKGEDGLPAIMPLKQPLDLKTKLKDPKILLSDKEKGKALLDVHEGSEFNVQLYRGMQSLKSRKHLGECFYYLLEGSGKFVTSESSHVVDLKKGSMVRLQPKLSHEVELADDAVLLSVDCSLDTSNDPVPTEVPILERDSSYANDILKREDFASEK